MEMLEFKSAAAAIAMFGSLSGFASLEWEETLDAPVWPDVTPECLNAEATPACSMRGAYFKGGVVSAADDDGTLKKTYRLRRKFTLKAKPTAAWLQGICDGADQVVLNGTPLRFSRYIFEPLLENRTTLHVVTDKLREGENEIVADYTVNRLARGGCNKLPAGVLLELFVRLQDGSSVRIDSDDAFESSSDGGKTWKGVHVWKAPPYPPRLARLRYHNVAVSHSVLGGGPAQPRVNAGEKVTLVYTLRGPAPQGRFSAKVSLSRDGSCWWDEEVELGPDNVAKQADGLWKLSIPFDAPLYSSGGKFEIGVWCNDICISDGSKMSGELEIMRLSAIPGEETSPAVSVVRQKGGKLGIAINGKPYPVLWGALAPRARADRLPRFGGAPLTVVSIHGQQYWQWHPRLGVYDFSYLDREAEKYRRANPDAKFIWNFMIFPPSDFALKYPEDMEADDLGDRTPVGRPCWSFASKRALAELQEMADRVIRHIEASPYGNRTIGYRFSSGVGVEWLGWDAKPGRVKGFSDLNKRAYADYAAKFCPQLADPHVPDLAEREDMDSVNDILWDQKKHLNAVAYMDYNSAIVVDDLLAVCGQAKDTLKVLGRQKLVGTFYGYCCYINVGGSEQFRGHLAVQKFLEENQGRVDFVCSPQSYYQRNLGDTSADMKPFASLENAGILTFLEDDTRTFNNPHPNWDTYCDACTEKQSVAEVQRNAAIQLCRLMSPYFYALVSGCEYDTPAFDRAFRDIRTTMEFCDTRGVTRHAEVALVTSERSIAALPRNKKWIETGRTVQRYGADGKVVRKPEFISVMNGEVFGSIFTKFSRAGVGYDLLLAENLKDFAGDYKLYVFQNAFKFDTDMLAAIEKIRARGATILWLYAPGYLNANVLADMKTLTGIEFAASGPGLAGVTMREDGRFMGTPGFEVAQLFSPVGADVVLGTYANGLPGVTASKTGKSVSFFSGPWQLDQKFIREIVRRSKAHVFCDSDDPVEANDALFTLHARYPGRKTVRLPRKADVVDVFNHRLVARDTDVFSFDVSLHDTSLFYYGPDAEELLRKLKLTKLK